MVRTFLVKNLLLALVQATALVPIVFLLFPLVPPFPPFPLFPVFSLVYSFTPTLVPLEKKMQDMRTIHLCNETSVSKIQHTNATHATSTTFDGHCHCTQQRRFAQSMGIDYHVEQYEQQRCGGNLLERSKVRMYLASGQNGA